MHSVGYRCVEEGWGFYWDPYSKTPYWVKPDGSTVTCVVDNYIPYVVEDESVVTYSDTVPICRVDSVPGINKDDDIKAAMTKAEEIIESL